MVNKVHTKDMATIPRCRGQAALDLSVLYTTTGVEAGQGNTGVT